MSSNATLLVYSSLLLGDHNGMIKSKETASVAEALLMLCWVFLTFS